MRDTARYEPFQEAAGAGRNPSLRKVARAMLGLAVQAGEHDSAADARIAMLLYQRHRRQWEKARPMREHLHEPC